MTTTSIATGATQQHNRKGALNRQGESRFICTDGAAATHSIWKDKIGNSKRVAEEGAGPVFLFEDPMSRLQKAKHEEELRKKQALLRSSQQDAEELEEEEQQMNGYGASKANNAEADEANGGGQDLLACLKCKQFGHLSYQCMNMFTREGQRGNESRQLLTTSTDLVLNAEEEAKERMMTEKATELMQKLRKAIQKKKDKKKHKKALRKEKDRKEKLKDKKRHSKKHHKESKKRRRSSSSSDSSD